MNCNYCSHPILLKRFSAKALDYSTAINFPILQCENCNLVQTEYNSKLEPEALDLYDSGAYQSTEGAVHRIGSTFLNFLERNKLEYFSAEKGNSLLEVGTGKGKLLLQSKKMGFVPFGQDIHLRVTEAVKQANIPLSNLKIDSNFKPAGFPDQFKHIVIWHVLEHIPSPKFFLEGLRTVCVPSTEVLIAVPNYASWQAQITGKNWYHLDPSRHCFHYDELSLNNLLDSSGFEIKKRNYNSFYLNFIGDYVSFLNCFLGTKNYPFNLLRKNPNAFHVKSSIKKLLDCILFFLLSFLFIGPILLFTLLSQMARRPGTLVLIASIKNE